MLPSSRRNDEKPKTIRWKELSLSALSGQEAKLGGVEGSKAGCPLLVKRVGRTSACHGRSSSGGDGKSELPVQRLGGLLDRQAGGNQ